MIDALRVYHLKKTASTGSAWMPVVAGTFALDTCQRKLVITYSENTEVSFSGCEHFSGLKAYEFLLRFSSGLESEVVGEADVFGQLKDAWKKFSTEQVLYARQYETLFQKLFEDTKEIRCRYLQGTGSQSYGSLVRRFLVSDEAGSKLSLIGSGKIAQSILPWLLELDLTVWNRGSDRLVDLEEERRARQLKACKLLSGEENEREAWSSADQIVVCIPVDEAADQMRLQWAKGKTVIHLGGNRVETHRWREALGEDAFFCLEDLYEVLNRQGSVRDEMILRARRACQERAQLRALGGSLSLPHGWEDLALFA